MTQTSHSPGRIWSRTIFAWNNREKRLDGNRTERLVKDSYPGFLIARKADAVHRGAPLLKFVHPIGQRRFGDDDHVRTVDVSVVFHVPQKRNRLERFPQTHLIGQNAVDAVFVQRNHPVETAHLVVPHFASFDVERGSVKAGDDQSLFRSLDLFRHLLVFFLLRLPVPVVGHVRHFPLLARPAGFQLQRAGRGLGTRRRHEMPEKFRLLQKIIKSLAAIHFLNTQIEKTSVRIRFSHRCRAILTIFLSKSSRPLTGTAGVSASCCTFQNSQIIRLETLTINNIALPKLQQCPRQ